MADPSVTITIKDPALGIIAEDTSADSAKLGVSTTGTVGQVYAYRGPDTTQLRADLGEGPLVEAVAKHLRASGGKTVYALKLTASVAGTNGTITKSNGASPTVTVAGAPVDDFQNIVKIVATGALGVGQFQYSGDGGDSYGPVLTIPSGGSYIVGTSGMTLTFPAGTYTAGDTYTWDSTGPGYSNSDFATGFDSLMADPRKWGFVHLVGSGVDAAAALTLATTMQSKLVAAMAVKRYARGIVELPAIDKALAITAFAAAAMDRVLTAGGFLELTSDVYAGRVYKRSTGWVWAANIARVPISVDASRQASDEDLHSLADDGVVRLVPSGAAASTGYHDETVTPGFDAARIAYAKTIPGLPGFYLGNPNLLSTPGSDFKWIQYGRIMDRACEIVNLWATKYLSKRLFPNPANGFILKKDAEAINRSGTAALVAGLVEPGHVPRGGASVVVNQADNLLSSPILRVKVRIVPPGYAKTVEVEIGFFNPAISGALAA